MKSTWLLKQSIIVGMASFCIFRGLTVGYAAETLISNSNTRKINGWGVYQSDESKFCTTKSSPNADGFSIEFSYGVLNGGLQDYTIIRREGLSLQDSSEFFEKVVIRFSNREPLLANVAFTAVYGTNYFQTVGINIYALTRMHASVSAEPADPIEFIIDLEGSNDVKISLIGLHDLEAIHGKCNADALGHPVPAGVLIQQTPGPFGRDSFPR